MTASESPLERQAVSPRRRTHDGGAEHANKTPDADMKVVPRRPWVRLALPQRTPLNPSMRPLSRLLLVVLLGFLTGARAAVPSFRAGAHAVDISPTNFPVRVNAMFTERAADKVVDPLFAKALVLDDGTTRLVLCVVDTCMMPRDLIDRAKADASKVTGIPTERMLVSATHTHSAPSAMGCPGRNAA